MSRAIKVSGALFWGVCAIGALPASAHAQPSIDLVAPPQSALPDRFYLAVDLDDNDEDGTPDSEQAEAVPSNDLVVVRLGPGTFALEGPFRFVREGTALPRAAASQGNQTLAIQAIGPGEGALVHQGHGRVALTAIELQLLRRGNQAIDLTRNSLGVSTGVTNDATLPRGTEFDSVSVGPENIRLQISGRLVDAQMFLSSGNSSENHRQRLDGAAQDGVWRSSWLRLVGDAVDDNARGVAHRTLRVQLADWVRAEARFGPWTIGQQARVGSSAALAGEASRDRLRGRLRVRILRDRPGGTPVIGETEAGALGLARQQVEIANEIWLQCFVGFGSPTEADIAVVDPPPPALLSFGDPAGFPATGGGSIRFTANGQEIEADTQAGALPVSTALRVAAVLTRAGFITRVSENPRTEFAAHRSADVLVRGRDGSLATLQLLGTTPLSTDQRQSAALGAVDLTDGLREFDNMTAAAGTIEERLLMRGLMDDDETTIDMIIINRFGSGTRQGEAFIEADFGTINNALILDRTGIRQQRASWTQSHELGHVLLDQPFHPDNVGPDRPWLLMDSSASSATVTGPKRLTEEECSRVRDRSGPGAVPMLLAPAPEG